MKKLLLGLALCSSIAYADELTIEEFYTLESLSLIMPSDISCYESGEETMKSITEWHYYFKEKLLEERKKYTQMPHVIQLDNFAVRYNLNQDLHCNQEEKSNHERMSKLYNAWAEDAFIYAAKMVHNNY